MKRKPLLFLAALALLPLIPAQAAVFTVSKTADTADGSCDGDCSLREAVIAANARAGFDAILLEAGTYRLTLNGAGEDLGATGDLDISDELTIVGEGGTFIEGSAGWTDRVIDVLAGVRLEIQDITIRQGRTSGQPGAGLRVAGELSLLRSIVTGNVAAGSTGGGIHVGADAVATAVQSTIHDNQADSGGGAYVEGTLNLTNSTVSGNKALTGGGGGLYFAGNAGGVIANSTIAFNAANTSASQKGGGIFAESAPFTSIDSPLLRNTIVARNSAGFGAFDPNAVTGRDCWGAVLSGGHNLLGDGSACIDFTPAKGDLEGGAAQGLDPKLSPLGEFGGPTPTHSLLAGSPAKDKGENCEAEDQRGADRPAACDIGAFEVTSQCVNGGGTLCLNDGRFQVQATWQTNQSTSGTGKGVQLTDESGYVWFFDPANVELTIKVLDGCSVNSRYWVFVGGLTNVGVQVTVTDTKTGAVKTYNNPINKTFAPILDTNAFNTCP